MIWPLKTLLGRREQAHLFAATAGNDAGYVDSINRQSSGIVVKVAPRLPLAGPFLLPIRATRERFSSLNRGRGKEFVPSEPPGGAFLLPPGAASAGPGARACSAPEMPEIPEMI